MKEVVVVAVEEVAVVAVEGVTVLEEMMTPMEVAEDMDMVVMPMEVAETMDMAMMVMMPIMVTTMMSMMVTTMKEEVVVGITPKQNLIWGIVTPSATIGCGILPCLAKTPRRHHMRIANVRPPP